MKKFIKENNIERTTQRHREIYLSDARKTEKSKLKTVLRYMVCYKWCYRFICYNNFKHSIGIIIWINRSRLIVIDER